MNTIGSVMKGPPSSGQHFRMGISSSVPPSFTTSWHGPLLSVFGIRSLRRPSIGSIFSVSSMPAGIFGLVSSAISAARSSSERTPSAMHIRFIDP